MGKAGISILKMYNLDTQIPLLIISLTRSSQEIGTFIEYKYLYLHTRMGISETCLDKKMALC